MSERTFENDGDEAEGLATGAGPRQSGGDQQNQGDGTEQDDRSAVPPHGDALDVDLEPPSA